MKGWWALFYWLLCGGKILRVKGWIYIDKHLANSTKISKHSFATDVCWLLGTAARVSWVVHGSTSYLKLPGSCIHKKKNLSKKGRCNKDWHWLPWHLRYFLGSSPSCVRPACFVCTVYDYMWLPQQIGQPGMSNYNHWLMIWLSWYWGWIFMSQKILPLAYSILERSYSKCVFFFL